MRWTVIVVLTTGTWGGLRPVSADPDPSASTSVSSAPDPQGALFSSQPLLRPLAPLSAAPPSLRLEAVRVAGERFAQDWRYPEPGAIAGFDGGGWFMGIGHYRPRTRRSAALHGGSIGATILGEILISSGSPLAGVGALITGATLDAAAADVDRNAEARRP
jgi:hypothetical protein